LVYVRYGVSVAVAPVFDICVVAGIDAEPVLAVDGPVGVTVTALELVFDMHPEVIITQRRTRNRKSRIRIWCFIMSFDILYLIKCMI